MFTIFNCIQRKSIWIVKFYGMKKQKPIHYLGKQSITKCGWTLYTGVIIVENTTKEKQKVTCKHCLSKI